MCFNVPDTKEGGSDGAGLALAPSLSTISDAYSEISPTEFGAAYPHTSLHRITTLVLLAFPVVYDFYKETCELKQEKCTLTSFLFCIWCCYD